MEYGYSCMGYEIAGGMGVKMAAPDREVYVMVGDGSYLMMAQEIVTAVQEGYKLNIVLLDNHGFSSIGGLSRSCGNRGMGTNYRYRENGAICRGCNSGGFCGECSQSGSVCGPGENGKRVAGGSGGRTQTINYHGGRDRNCD